MYSQVNIHSEEIKVVLFFQYLEYCICFLKTKNLLTECEIKVQL